MEWLANPENWLALVTLTVLEIVLGIDNVIFISILVGKLPEKQQPKARRLGLFLAMFLRIGLLASIAWMAKLTAPLFTVLGQGISGRDLILLTGGVFLLFKATREIHDRLEGDEGEANAR
ncbi:MAG TPA: TerC family protein, partial [Thermoanaerobaculia bacterium]